MDKENLIEIVEMYDQVIKRTGQFLKDADTFGGTKASKYLKEVNPHFDRINSSGNENEVLEYFAPKLAPYIQGQWNVLAFHILVVENGKWTDEQVEGHLKRMSDTIDSLAYYVGAIRDWYQLDG